jgi:hypothetical protein
MSMFEWNTIWRTKIFTLIYKEYETKAFCWIFSKILANYCVRSLFNIANWENLRCLHRITQFQDKQKLLQIPWVTLTSVKLLVNWKMNILQNKEYETKAFCWIFSKILANYCVHFGTVRRIHTLYKKNC